MNTPTPTPGPSSSQREVRRVTPRAALAALPAYAAGKPASEIPGLVAYKLASNENPFGAVPAVREAVAAFDDYNRYPDPAATVLRESLSGYLGVPAEDIVAGAGSLGALNQLLAAFAGTGEDGRPDEVVYAWRSFEAYPISVGLAGALSVQVPNLPDGSHDLDAMADAITDRTRVVLLCTPNNPTGPSLRDDAVREFLERVPSDVVVVVDEAYWEFQRSEGLADGIALYREHPNVVSLRTFSKAHGLAGLRVGYTVAQQDVTRYLRQSAPAFAVTELAQRAAEASVENIEQVEERVQLVVDERERVLAGLAELGWQHPRTEANFVWLPLGDHSADFARLCDEHALSVRCFTSQGVRVSFGEPEANSRFLELCAAFPHPSTMPTPRHT
ncbi:aminotransferase [Kocuria tytonicola]|uniref:Histidinol-phosphate aminotransferase n=1 Tax=Kocuria tytonicola TaxID=2055946 RepID=A0A3L9M1S7_9MICC|nr:histidinol-phosphate transaminase [Kocuria tytonicola]RLY94191.1 aminotransferase class I/II-fold pyridoxal phosphate-dependent enzyme [Kocuria tytonicola]RLZ02553.1 aminotransferase [Kocuria tytonicola]